MRRSTIPSSLYVGIRPSCALLTVSVRRLLFLSVAALMSLLMVERVRAALANQGYRARDAHGLNALAPDRLDGEGRLSELDGRANLGDLTELLIHEPADGVGLDVRDLDVERLLQVVDGEASADHHLVVGHDLQLLDLAHVVLVADRSDDLLNEVLEGHDPRRATVLVND